MGKRLKIISHCSDHTKFLTMLGGLLVGLLGAGFALNNHNILLPGLCQPCSASMLPCTLYLLIICWIGRHFGRAAQQQMWAISSMVMIFFIFLGCSLLWIFPKAPSNMVPKALWERGLPKIFLSYWSGGGTFLYLNAHTKDRSLFRLSASITIWSKTLLAGGVGFFVDFLGVFYDTGQLPNINGHWLGFVLFASVGGALLWLASYGFTLPHPTKAQRNEHKMGAYHLLAMLFSGACVTANLLVVKHLAILGSVVTAGLFVYVMTFVLTDVISEVYGKTHAQMVVAAGFLSNLVLMSMVGIIRQCQSAEADGQAFLLNTFGFFFAVVLASIIAYLISQLLDIYLFSLIRRKTEGQWLWLRNNTATMISQTVDTFLFACIAWGIWSWAPSGKGNLTWTVWQSIAWQEWGWKLGLALLDTPLVYLLIKQLRPQINKTSRVR